MQHITALVIYLFNICSSLGELREHWIATMEWGEVNCGEPFDVLNINEFLEPALLSALLIYQLKRRLTIFETR
jgi:hypothetical protein